MRNGSLLFVSGLVLALGCSSTPEPLLEDPGKADSVNPVCSKATEFAGAETSQDLEESVVSAVELSAADADSLTSTQAAQLLAAAVFVEIDHEDFDSEDASTVFNAVDEGTIELLELEVDEDGSVRKYDWVRFFIGDNEAGIVFVDNTRIFVAEIGDGDVLGCVTPLSPEQQQEVLNESIAQLLEEKGMAGMSFAVDLLESQIQGDIDNGVSFDSALTSAVEGILADGGILLAFTEGEIPSAEGCPELPFEEGLACALGSLGSLRLVALGEEIDGASPDDSWVFEITVASKTYFAAVNRADSTASARIIAADIE